MLDMVCSGLAICSVGSWRGIITAKRGITATKPRIMFQRRKDIPYHNIPQCSLDMFGRYLVFVIRNHTKDMICPTCLGAQGQIQYLLYTDIYCTIDYHWLLLTIRQCPLKCDRGRQHKMFHGLVEEMELSMANMTCLNCAGQNRTISHCTSGSPHGKKWSRHPQNRIQMEVSSDGGTPKSSKLDQIGSF